FSSRRRHTRFSRDWSSDVCSSDLTPPWSSASTTFRRTEAISMARKRLVTTVKIQLPAGQATPAPPVGTVLGPHGVNLMDFVKAYNDATANQRGQIIPAEISIYEDRTFTF